MRIIATIQNEGFKSVIREDDNLRVYFTADADIDADGANGQNGHPAAYRKDNKGSELLANGDMKVVDGKVVFNKGWGRDVVIVGKDNQPKIFPKGIIASKTWYQHPGKFKDDPEAYLDSETIPYIVVPPVIVQSTKGIVRGCLARVTYNNISVDAVVGDSGPANKIGELSIAAARALGISPNPRNGGLDTADILYELWPGVAAPGYFLQRA